MTIWTKIRTKLKYRYADLECVLSHLESRRLNHSMSHRVQSQLKLSLVKKTNNSQVNTLPAGANPSCSFWIAMDENSRQKATAKTRRRSSMFFSETHSFIITDKQRGGNLVLWHLMLTAGLGVQAKYLPTANRVENTVCLLAPHYLQMIKDNTSLFYRRPVQYM